MESISQPEKKIEQGNSRKAKNQKIKPKWKKQRNSNSSTRCCTETFINTTITSEEKKKGQKEYLDNAT